MGSNIVLLDFNAGGLDIDSPKASHVRCIINSALGIIGGVAELLTGAVSEELSGGLASPLAVPLFYDGMSRIELNVSRLFGYANGNDKFADAMP